MAEQPALIRLDDIDSFSAVADFPAPEIRPEVVSAVRELDEREALEPFLRAILTDLGDTPHGPAEIADILTHKLLVKRSPVYAAFILKGKSFRTVRPKDVAHQIYRLEKIVGLELAVFAYSGTVLDAAKEQFLSTTCRIGCRALVLDPVELARLFLAYGFLCPRDGSRIMAGRCRCGYSPTYRILNVLQDEALKELLGAHRLRQPRALVVLPPGTGKTRIAAEDAKRLKAQHMLYVAHTHEILDVAQSELEAVFGAAHVMRHFDVATLTRPAPANLVTVQLLSPNIEQLPRDVFNYVVIDEFHHAAAPSYRRLLDTLNPDFLLGLTATPFRGDRQDIVDLCDGNILVNYDLRSGIETGILTPYHYFGCFDNVDYSSIRHNGQRYDIRDLEKALLVPERDEGILKTWRRHADGRPTLAFACTHRHAERMADCFNRIGVRARPYLSTTPRDERVALLKMFATGEITVLCAVDVLNEGADLPHVECLLFLRPTESKRIFFQQLGRGLRRGVGKSHCVVIDFIGNFKNAYRIPEYQGLLSSDEEAAHAVGQHRSAKDVLNLPLGCQVEFDERVIELFERQVLDPRHATRSNIARILLYQYDRLAARLGHAPSRNEVNRLCMLDADLYNLVFGSWRHFEELARARSGASAAFVSADL